jgi:monoamine oxidase
LRGNGRFHVGGDQVSYLPGWQEGAILSAYHVVNLILGRGKLLEAQVSDKLPAPDSASTTGAD